MVRAPTGALTTVTAEAPAIAGNATFVQNQIGNYVLRVSASDAAGRMADCEFPVESVTGPPVAFCPDEVHTPVGEPITIMGEAFDAVCKDLRDTGQPALVQEIIARRIIKAATKGERDPVRLRKAGLAALGYDREAI